MSETPILDLEQAPPEPSREQAPLIIGAVLGAVVVTMFILKDQGALPQWHWPAFNILLFFPALYVVIAFHEIGHLVAGNLVGVDAGGIAVGAFVLIKSGKNWAFRFDRRGWLRGGFFKPLTPSVDFDPSRHAWMVAGGPLASIALTVLCGWLFLRYGSGEWNWIGCLFWTSLFIVIMSGIPFSAGLQKSDGARLWLLIRHPERAQRWTALLAIQTEEASGVRPREWNPRMFDQVLVIEISATEYLYGQLLAFYRRLDEGLEDTALEHLENALAGSARAGKALRHGLFLEAACASAIIRKRSGQARNWRDRACKVRKPESLDVVDAGIAMCEAHFEEATQHWQAARARVDQRSSIRG